MYALNIDADGRVLSATFPEYAPDSAPIVEALPAGDIADYLYINGGFIYEPLPAPEEPTPSNEERIAELEAALELLLSGAVE